ncbi:MAG: RecT family recombinase [Pseudomonadota bacterium]
MTGNLAVVESGKQGIVATMAGRFSMQPEAFASTVKKTVMPNGECTNEQLAALLMVAREYDLNPLTKEIYAFPNRGGIQPIVSIDGWMKLINSHPDFDGMRFEDRSDEQGGLVAITCIMYRKGRTHPTEATEYMAECVRSTDPWKKWPRRMLRHKAAIQCARYAFSFAGIMEPDEAERWQEVASPRSTVAEKFQDEFQSDDASEGFGTGDEHLLNPPIDPSPEPPEAEPEQDEDVFPGDLPDNEPGAQGAADAAAAPEPEGGSPNQIPSSGEPSSGIEHLVGQHRDLIIQFAKDYYMANDKPKVSEEYRNDFADANNDDVRDAANKVRDFVKKRQMGKLCAFLGITEAQLKGNG